MRHGKRYIGIAGWNVPQEFRESHLTYLERYSQLFPCVEINSSFYKSHMPRTYERWSKSVPSDFRFSVKVPKIITHTNEDPLSSVGKFIDGVCELGDKLGPLLMQFPPKRAFNAASDQKLFIAFRGRYKGPMVCEPRHFSWFRPEAQKVLKNYSISLVAADPKPVSNAPDLFGDGSITYLRLHGSPRMYFSSYTEEFLDRLKENLKLCEDKRWVIFDNTAHGYAYQNALKLLGVTQVRSQTQLKASSDEKKQGLSV